MKLAVRKRFGRWYVFYGSLAALKAGGFDTLTDALAFAHGLLLKRSLRHARAH